MKNEPEHSNNDSPQDTESWSKSMHKRFVPDPGVVPIGETLSMARRIQKKAEPHALTQSLLNRYTPRREAGRGSFGDMPFQNAPRMEESPALIVQGVFRENSIVQKKDASPVVTAQPAAASTSSDPDHSVPESSKGEIQTKVAQGPSGEKPPVSVHEAGPMAPPAVSFASQVSRGKRSLVQRALDRSGGTMGLVKAPVKTVIPQKSPAPVVQAKQVTGGLESTPFQKPVTPSEQGRFENRQGAHRDQTGSHIESPMADMPRVQERIQTGEPVIAKDMLVKSAPARNTASSETATASVAQKKAESPSPVAEPAKAMAPNSDSSPSLEAPPVVQAKTEMPLPEPVSPKAVVSRSNTDSSHGDLPVVRPNPGTPAGADKTTMPMGKNAPPSSASAPAIQRKTSQPEQDPVVQAQARMTSAREPAAQAPPQGVQPGSPDPAVSSPGSKMPVIQSRSDMPLPSVKGKGQPHERSGRDNPSFSGQNRGLNPVPPAVQAVQRVRETIRPDSGTSRRALETPLVLNETTLQLKTDSPSAGQDDGPEKVPAHETARPASPDMADRPSDASVRSGAMPVVRPVQHAPERIQGGPVFSGTPLSPSQSKASPVVQAKRTSGRQTPAPAGQQATPLSGNPHATETPAPSSDGGLPVIQQVRVPDIHQNQRFDFGPLPMARATKAETPQSSASESPVQRQSGGEAMAQQGPSTGGSAASQPSPVSMDPIQAPSMEGATMNNLHEIAERVYDMLMDRLSIERESLGL